MRGVSIGAAAVATALALYVNAGGVSKAGVAEPAPKPADAKLRRVSGVYPKVSVNDAAGRPHPLASFKGKVTVVNLWATWCAPCKKEMPSLAILQKELAGAGVQIVPVSIDSKKAVGGAKAFIAANAPLPFYHDDEGAVTPAMTPTAVGYPTTYIFDRKGRLYGEVEGEADWSGPKIRALLQNLAKE